MAMLNLDDTKFLRIEDLQHKETVIIETPGDWVESKTFKKDDGTPANIFEIKIKTQKEETKIAPLPLETLKVLGAEWGPDTTLWVGKKIRA